MPEVKWTQETIKVGIEKYILEHGEPPTSRDFDTTSYLPSARQVQRAFGGLSALRAQLGYADLDYTIGTRRSEIASRAGKRGVEAEEALELLLVAHFGEPFVHTQKRYIKHGKSRYDFFIYAENYSFGVDVFATDRRDYIETNVRHKIGRYAETSTHIPIYFVLSGDTYQTGDVAQIREKLLSKYPNLHLLTVAEFIIMIKDIAPLGVIGNLQSIAQD